MSHLEIAKYNIRLELKGNPDPIPVINSNPYTVSSGGVLFAVPMASYHVIEASVSREDFRFIQSAYGQGINMVVLTEAGELFRKIEIPKTAHYSADAYVFDQEEYWVRWVWYEEPGYRGGFLI